MWLFSERIRETEQEADEMVEKRVQLLMNELSQSSRPKKRKMSDGSSGDDEEWVSSILLHQETVKLEVCL